MLIRYRDFSLSLSGKSLQFRTKPQLGMLSEFQTGGFVFFLGGGAPHFIIPCHSPGDKAEGFISHLPRILTGIGRLGSGYTRLTSSAAFNLLIIDARKSDPSE